MIDGIRLPALAAILMLCSCRGGAEPAVLFTVDPGASSGGVAEGGLSDLARDPSDPSGRTLLAINDRGPNDPSGGEVFFPHPFYHQKIFRFRTGQDGKPVLAGVDSIRDSRGRWTSGLPSPRYSDAETPVGPGADGARKRLAPDSAGFDFEGLAGGDSGTLWASEEYGPRIVRLRPDGPGARRIDRELSPGAGLPAVFSRRAANKGLEALCRLADGDLVAIFQGGLANAISGDPKSVAERTLARRLVRIDPATGAVREHLALMPDDPSSGAKRRTRIGACTALDSARILVLEHRKGKKGRIELDVAEWDLSKATDVHLARDTAARGRLVDGATLEEAAMDPDRIRQTGIRPIDRKPVAADLVGGIDERLAKPEGLALLPDGRALVSFDNDFGKKGDPRTRFLLAPLRIPAASR